MGKETSGLCRQLVPKQVFPLLYLFASAPSRDWRQFSENLLTVPGGFDLSGGMLGESLAEGLFQMANGHYIKGIITMLKK